MFLFKCVMFGGSMWIVQGVAVLGGWESWSLENFMGWEFESKKKLAEKEPTRHTKEKTNVQRVFWGPFFLVGL